MNRFSMTLVALCFRGVFLPIQGYAGDAPAHDMYKIGEAREYEIAVPRYGLKGSPALFGHPPLRSAREDKDFEKHFVRIQVVENRPMPDGHRIVQRVDGMDKEGHITKKGLYYIYVDICPKGTQVIGSYSDDCRDGDDTNARCPFNCSRSPAVGFKNGKVGGYVFFQGHGVMYAQQAGETPSALAVQVTRFENPKAFEKDSNRTVHWYRSDIADLAMAGSGGTILFCEKQQWDKAEDWLWKKMERFDAEGNILMRCVRTKYTDAAPGGKEKRQEAADKRE